MLKGTRVAAAILISFLIPSAFAQPLTFPSLSCGKWLVQLGGFYSQEGKNQNIGIVDMLGDRFTVFRQYDGNVVAGVGYYLDAPSYRSIDFMAGLNAFYLAHTIVKGDVIQEDAFQNLGYHYNVDNYPLYAVLKGVVNKFGPAMTFDVGLGVNFLKTSNFNEYSLGAGTIPDNAFKGSTRAVFSATLGAGIVFHRAFSRADVEFGYRFFYLGEGYLHKQTDQLSNDLKTGDIYANALIISLSI
jgi:hypothetical protein